MSKTAMKSARGHGEDKQHSFYHNSSVTAEDAVTDPSHPARL